MTDAELDRLEAQRQEQIDIQLDRMPRCPACNSQDVALRKYRAPGVVAPDYTCSWWSCNECGFESEPS